MLDMFRGLFSESARDERTRSHLLIHSQSIHPSLSSFPCPLLSKQIILFLYFGTWLHNGTLSGQCAFRNGNRQAMMALLLLLLLNGTNWRNVVVALVAVDLLNGFYNLDIHRTLLPSAAPSSAGLDTFNHLLLARHHQRIAVLTATSSCEFTDGTRQFNLISSPLPRTS